MNFKKFNNLFQRKDDPFADSPSNAVKSLPDQKTPVQNDLPFSRCIEIGDKESTPPPQEISPQPRKKKTKIVLVLDDDVKIFEKPNDSDLEMYKRTYSKNLAAAYHKSPHPITKSPLSAPTITTKEFFEPPPPSSVEIIPESLEKVETSEKIEMIDNTPKEKERAKLQIQLESSSVNRGFDLNGKVTLRVSHPIKTRGIWLRIEGCDCSFWTGGKDVYQDAKSFLDYKTPLCLLEDSGDETKTISFEPGIYNFPILFLIPLQTPLSFRLGSDNEFRRGISYRVSATMIIPFAPDVVTTESFTVTGTPDWMPLLLAEPVSVQSKKNMVMGGVIDVMCYLSKSVAIIGEELLLSIQMYVSTRWKSITCTVALMEKHKQITTQILAVEKRKVTRWKVLEFQVDSFGQLQAGDRATQDMSIKLDPQKVWASCVTPNQLLTISHYLHITVSPSAMAQNLELKVPFTTLPQKI
eukprot:TRINITY_DN18046_c0_g1_i1.p1 TRINITY_DN18046_c0_g1~~TRINITY_DN18046_c0_g1_i1.p1  ORF type:complete len:467 (+),score=65.66 TRINITY_DN18046_c0_g1_i1:43-1443(+)